MDNFWTSLVTAAALVLLLEGLVPFASPKGWKRAFKRILDLTDGQIRFFGLISITLGLLLLLFI